MRSRAYVFATAVVMAIARAAAAGPPEKLTGSCTDSGCHADLIKGPVLHSPVDKGVCDACHQVKDERTHKFAFTTDEATLCNECHGETLEGLPLVHGPVAVGQCTACHSPHSSTFPKLLKTDEKSACVECHSEVSDRLASAKKVHQPVETGCTACHNPHGSKNKSLLASAPPQLCLDCHDDIAARLTANPHRHGPIENGDCTACHDAHGSKWKSLTAHAYPETFYTPYGEEAYKLCFECHEAEAFASAETDDATGFRNGTRNLHFLHVNKSPKGRSCRACHDPHASKNEKHVAEFVPFGKWKIPLNFRQNPTGGSCASGCHRAVQYDREQPFNNSASK